jgi:hypothetical protein
MGYQTSCYGQIVISPPLTWREMKGSPFLPNEEEGADEEMDVVLVLSDSTKETDEGTVIVRTAAFVEQRYEDESRNYTIEKTLQALIDAFPGHEFTGRFDCEGEEQGDMWRLVANGRTSRRINPTITWPES